MLLGDRYFEEDGQYWYKRKTGKLKCDIYTCQTCEDEFCRPKSFLRGEGIYCSKSCSLKSMMDSGKHIRKGEDHGKWNGGRIKTNYGYIKLYSPDHPSVEGKQHKYMFEHRLVMENHIGRFLLPDEDVHHINGVKTDNRIENLELWSHSHPKGQRVEDLLKWANTIIETYGT